MSNWETPYANYQPYGHPEPARKIDAAAILALVLSITSFIFWIAPAVLALVLAPYAKKRVLASEGTRGGAKMIIAAQIVSTASLSISALLMLIIAFN